MYLEYYKLKAKPFQITADPKFLWLGEKHKEALATLRYGIVDNRGFLLLTGEVGTGKTILINHLTTLLDIDTVVATLPDPDLESMDFYNLLADGLQMNRTFDSKGAFLIHLRDFLHQSYADDKQVLLIIDESQRLNSKLMEDIRVLSNIELHDRKLINIFFVGQQEFNSILMTPQNRALSQRITVRYHIEPLSQAETAEYVVHRLNVAGRVAPIFKKAALDEIFRFSGGIPRLINIISDHALLTGYSDNLKRIDATVVRECAEELRIPNQISDATAANVKKAAVPPAKEAAEAVPKDTQPESPVSSTTIPTAKLGPPEDKAPQGFSLAWKFIYAVIVLGLIAVVTYGISQFGPPSRTRYDVEDLTPQKYKTSLAREKALLSENLDGQDGEDLAMGQESDSSATPADPQSAPTDTAAVTSAPNRVPDSVKEPTAGETSVSPSSPKPVNAAVDAAGSETGGDNPQASHGTATRIPPEAAPDATAPGMRTAAPGQAIVSIPDQASTSVDTEAVAPQGEARALAPPPELEPLPLLDETITIPFGINSNEIEPQHYALLDRVAAHLVADSNRMIDVRGHTDSSGPESYNLSVSRFRASAVKSYLVGKGVLPGQINVVAMGANDPIASNASYQGRILNRRVEIVFIERRETSE